MARENDGKYLIASIYYLVGNIIGQGIVLLSSSIFTRMMSKEAYGLVSTYSAWVLVLNTFIGLNLFITVRNAYIDYREEYHKFVSSVLLLSLMAFLIFTGLIVSILALWNRKTDLFVVFLAALQAISVHTINMQMAVYSMENRYKSRTMLMIFPNVVHTILSVILIAVYTSNQYYGKILGNVFGLVIFAIVIIIYNFKNEKPVINKEYWRYATQIAVPGIMLTLSDLILMQSDRIMLTDMVGADETAVYSLVYNIGSILIALYTAINGAWTPWFYKNLAIGEISLTRKVEAVYIKVFVLITMGLLTVSPEVIKILSPETYWRGVDYVNLIVFASFLIFVYAFFTAYLMYLKKPGVIAKNTAMVAVLNIILNYMLIPRYRAVGAAMATIISYIILFMLHYRAAIQYKKSVFCRREMMIGILGMALYCGIFYFILNNWVIRYGVVILIIVFLGIEFMHYRKNKNLK